MIFHSYSNKIALSIGADIDPVETTLDIDVVIYDK